MYGSSSGKPMETKNMNSQSGNDFLFVRGNSSSGSPGDNCIFKSKTRRKKPLTYARWFMQFSGTGAMENGGGENLK